MISRRHCSYFNDPVVLVDGNFQVRRKAQGTQLVGFGLGRAGGAERKAESWHRAHEATRL